MHTITETHGRRRRQVTLCEGCGNPYSPWRASSRFCSKRCANEINGAVIVRGGEQECQSCKANKPRAAFSRIDRKDRSKRKDICIDCSKRERAEKRQRRLWYHKKIPAILTNCKIRAREMGVEFSLTRDDIVIPERCPVFGVVFEEECKKANRYFCNSYAPSVDRIDNSKGYTKDNIVIVSCRANSIKGNATIAELFQVANFYASLDRKA